MNTQPSLQLQQAVPAEPSELVDNLSCSEPPHGASNNGHGAEQDSTGNGSSNSYDITSENGSRAAQVLHNADDTGNAATMMAPSQSGFTAVNATTVHSLGRPPQAQVQQLYTSHTTSDQAQTRPHSSDTNEEQALASKESSSLGTSLDCSSEEVPPQYDQQQAQQHTASPTQDRNDHKTTTAVNENGAMATAGTSQPYKDYIPSQPPDEDTAQTPQSTTQASSHTPQPPELIVQPPSSGITEPSVVPSTTVDTTTMSDPQPDHLQQQSVRDATCAEQEREDKELRTEKEQAEEYERRQKEEVTRQEQIATNQPMPGAKKDQKQQAPAPITAQSSAAEASGVSADGSDLEAEIRAMMAKMRELNNKDPQLLARIWEEERRARTPKLPITTTKSAPQPPVVPPPQEPTPPVANQGKKATPRKSPSAPAVKSATPIQKPALQATIPVPAATQPRSGGGAIWPHEKKLEIARVAAEYLANRNSSLSLDAGQIFQILQGNPTYVRLCEQLEQMGFRLIRANFARHLLQCVPGINYASRTTISQPIPPAQPADVERPIATPVALYPRHTPAPASPMDGSLHPLFPGNDVSAAGAAGTSPPIPIANMISPKPELKQPVSKEEAARKRSLSDLVDLSQLDEDDMGPPMKRLHSDQIRASDSSNLRINDAMDKYAAPVTNFPITSIATPHVGRPVPGKRPIPASELRRTAVVEPLDKKKALRRNTYNPATIARDVLIACGRHPYERQLNQHLDVLKTNISQISNESDLSTIKWNIIDPGDPPPGYFK